MSRRSFSEGGNKRIVRNGPAFFHEFLEEENTKKKEVQINMATRRSNRRGGVDRVSLLANIIREVDPDMKDAITLEGEKPKKGKSKKEQERIVKEVPLEGPVATERASRLVRLMEDEHYYTLMIGPKSEIRSGKRPPRSITICKEELPTLKELFAAL